MNVSLSIFRAFHAILGATTATFLYTYTVQCTTYYMVAHTRQVFYSTPTYEDNTVFLEIVTFVWYVSDNLDAIGKANLSYLTDCGIRLLRSSSHDLNTNTSTKWVSV